MNSTPDVSARFDDPPAPQDAGPAEASRFTATHWSVVLRAGSTQSPEADQALEKLCRAYWKPLYAYARRLGHSAPDAEDFTQGFFAHFLERGLVRSADQTRGRFRTYLLTSFQRFIQKQWVRANAAKRGGELRFLSFDQLDGEWESAAPADAPSPDQAFDREWAAQVFTEAMAQLQQEFAAAGRTWDFDHLKRFLAQPADQAAYAQVAQALGAKPETVAVATHRLRARYGELVRQTIEHTVSRPEEVEDELRYLRAVIRQ